MFKCRNILITFIKSNIFIKLFLTLTISKNNVIIIKSFFYKLLKTIKKKIIIIIITLTLIIKCFNKLFIKRKYNIKKKVL